MVRAHEEFMRVNNALGALVEIAVAALHSLTLKLHSSQQVFVTASDFSHEKSLEQLLTSISQKFPRAKTVVFDLGMTTVLVDKISLRRNVKVIEFSFPRYPTWFDLRLNSGSYAWKAQCVREVLTSKMYQDGNGSRLAWVDAGCVFVGLGTLAAFQPLTTKNGVFANLASGSVQKWTHTSSLRSMRKSIGPEFDEGIMNKRQFSAAFISFDTSKSWVRELIMTWAELSLKKEVIGPIGASKANHRFDQSVFSALLHLSDRKSAHQRRAFPQALLGFRIHQDIEEATPSDLNG
jgi:hypothetical protein